MRLLYLSSQGSFCLTNDLDVVPRYAILSHTWGADEDELTFEDIQNGRGRDKSGGYTKVEFCAAQAKKDGIDHFWIDTCCINKASEPELSEAIRSMFRWYRESAKCYVYLSDVSALKRDANNESDRARERTFRSSRRFTRGWTLQELLAPRTVEFFSRDRVLLGSRATLIQQLYEITGIPQVALHGKHMTSFSVEERFTWAEKRHTRKVEDQAYCLFGIFDVQLPILYGEGQESAMRRLMKEVGVTSAQIGGVIRNGYENGRLTVERLSGEPLPLDACFINLGIVRHYRDIDLRSFKYESDRDEGADFVSRFSLAKRLKVEIPPASEQVSLVSLFEPRIEQNKISVRPRRVLIWGRAGMGKTTLCKKIVHDVYNNGLWKGLYDRVIWLPLRKLKRISSRNIVELLQSEFAFTGLGEHIPEALSKLVQDNRTLFLLDGLDEVSLALEQDSPGESVLHELLSQPDIIITSRPHSHNTRVLSHQAIDLELETVGFFPAQVEEYLQRVAQEAKMADNVVEGIRSFIQQYPLVQSLAGIPVQLDAICYTWNTRDFPRDNATMATLYLAISKSLWKNTTLRLGKMDDGKLITRQQLQYWSWRRCEKLIKAETEFLQELAFRGLCEEAIEFSIKDVELLESSQQIHEDKIIHLAFLRVSDSSVDTCDQTFHFLHLTYQEFFAAQYFVRHWTSRTELLHYEKLMHRRRSGERDKLVTPEGFLQSEKHIDRYHIFWQFVMGLLGNEDDVYHLYQFLDALENEPVDLIALALDAMSRRSTVSTDMIDFVTQKLGDSTSHEVRSLLIQFIGRHCGPAQESKVLKLFDDARQLRTNPLEIVRAWNGTQLLLGPAVEALVRLLEHPDRSVRYRAASALEYQPSLPNTIAEALVALLQYLEYDMCYQIVRALGSHADLPSTVVVALFTRLQYSDSSMRYRIVYTLNRQDSLPHAMVRALIDVLVELLVQHPDRDMRYRAAAALGKYAVLPNTAIEALVSRLEDSDSGVRYQIICALRQQDRFPEMAFGPLVARLEDSDGGVRYEAGCTLRQRTIHLDATLESPVGQY